MLNSFSRVFDYSDYEKKLRHYFSDSAPIQADIVIGLQEAQISCEGKAPVSCGINDKLSVAENVKKVIDVCIESLYPKMAFSEQIIVPFSDEQKKSFLMQGLSIDRIHEKEQVRRWVYFTLIRFNEHNSTIDYIEEVTKIRFRAHLYKPLMLVKDKIWGLSAKGRDGMGELYRYLMSESKQEFLKSPNAEDKECGTQEF